MDISIGCDPELFLRSKETGNIVSAYGLLPGTKQEPHIVPNGAVQVDGMAGEFNTNPANTFDEFNGNITSVLECMRQMIPDDLDFAIVPSTVFTDDILMKMPDKAKELGCDPDYNAYTMEANPKPVPPAPGLRTASGHVHIGLGAFPDYLNEVHFTGMAQLVRGLDRFVGTASVIMDPDPTRRVLYGAAGAFRVKPYGCEYRVPSNAWITTEERRKLVFDLVHSTVEWLVNGSPHNVTDDEVIDAINTSNVIKCQEILDFMLRS